MTSHETAVATLLASWRDNADRWTDAVRSGAIASRRLVTDEAVVQAVLGRKPSRVLDLGCGEGWLVRALAPHVAEVAGVDASPELVARAEASGGGSFRCASYAEIVDDPSRCGDAYDVIVANFSLLDATLQPLLLALHRIARPSGALVVQTVHPFALGPPYENGWREEDFAGFGAGSWSRMPWYFRTVGAWINEVAQSWRVVDVAEPLHPETRQPVSLLMTALAE